MNVVDCNSFSHVFENDAVVKPLRPLASLFGGCFCWAPAPFSLSGLLFLLTKRKSGWGICGSSGWLVFCLFDCDLPFQTDLVLVQIVQIVQIDVLPLMLM